MFKLNTKSDADSLLYLLSHLECDGHTVHMLTQWHLPPPLTSTMKLSLFTHVNSKPLSLATRLHQCHTNCFHYINNGWTFLDRPILYICMCVCIYTFLCICQRCCFFHPVVCYFLFPLLSWFNKSLLGSCIKHLRHNVFRALSAISQIIAPIS